MKDLIKGIGSSITSGITSGIGGSISGAVGGMLGDVLGLGRSAEKRQWEYEQKRMQQQFEYNKQMADYNHMLGIDMFSKTGYGAQAAQMREAGLNPALMYGSAGSSGQATQGTGASVQQGNTQAVAMGLNLQQMQKQIELADAQIRKTNEEAKTEESKRGVNASISALNDTLGKLNTAKLDEIPKVIEKLSEEIRGLKSNNNVLTATENERIAKIWNESQKSLWEQIGTRLDKQMKEKELSMLEKKSAMWEDFLNAELKKLESEGKLNEINAELANQKINELLIMIGCDGKEGLLQKEFRLKLDRFDLDETLGWVNAGIKAAGVIADVVPIGKIVKLIKEGITKAFAKK